MIFLLASKDVTEKKKVAASKATRQIALVDSCLLSLSLLFDSFFIFWLFTPCHFCFKGPRIFEPNEKAKTFKKENIHVDVKLNLISSRGQFGWQLQLCFFPLWVASLFFSFSLDNKDTREMMSPSAFFFPDWWEWDKDNKGGNRVATAAVVHTRVTFDGFLFAILVCHLAVSLSLLHGILLLFLSTAIRGGHCFSPYCWWALELTRLWSSINSKSSPAHILFSTR